MASDTIFDILKAYHDGTATSQTPASRIDDAGGGVSYVGKAAIGSATLSAAWQIQRLTEVTGDLTIEWADGNANFDNIWDNRASLTYI